ncbi:MAG: hypothetical protein ACKVUS_04005 [Saprospiraceae bacterium]
MKNNLSFLLFLGFGFSVSAQEVPLDSFYYRQNGENILFEGVPAKSNEALRTFINDYDLLSTMFPAVIVPRPVLDRVVTIGNRQSVLADSLSILTNRLTYQDRLNALEIEKKDKIIAAQKEFIEFNDKNREMLNQSIASLNTQLDVTRKLAGTNAQASRWQKRWAFILGGSLGVGLGAVLGVLIAK